jgi:hypothetical protein
MTNFIYEETEFLNVDLDVCSKSDLQPMVTALGRKIIALYVGHDEGRYYSAHLELARMPKTADTTIQGFGALIRALPRAERRLWDTAVVRDFNIGVQAALQPRSYEIPLSSKTIEAASKLKARIVITVYAAEVSKSYRRKSSKKVQQRSPRLARRN